MGPLRFSKFPLSDHGVLTKIVQTPPVLYCHNLLASDLISDVKSQKQSPGATTVKGGSVVYENFTSILKKVGRDILQAKQAGHKV